MKFKTIILGALLISFGLSIKAQDKLGALRTSKKIISMAEPQAPYFAIQIIALKLPPMVPEFFRNVEKAREYPCDDGYLRFCVGEFNSYDEAKAAIASVKADGYDQAFVVDTRKYLLKESYYSGGGTTRGSGRSVGSSDSKKKIDPNKTYTVQLSAFRFPVYLSHFENVDNVMEFRLKDKIFRYTVGKFKGKFAEEELNKIKALGYKNAHLVELALYMPYKIE